jgi:hypothetical protein
MIGTAIVPPTTTSTNDTRPGGHRQMIVDKRGPGSGESLSTDNRVVSPFFLQGKV